MLIRKSCLLLGLAMLSAAARGQERYLHTDSLGSDASEASHVFYCADNRIALSYVERVHRDESLNLVDRWRISLTALSVSGRQIEPAGMRTLEARFHEFAWLERVTARCTRFNREVYITAVGMRAEAWAAFGEDRVAERPDPTSVSFTVREDGTITLD